MKFNNKVTVVVLAVLFVFVGFGSFAEAQEALGPGRPDPTGRGRYMQFGKEVTYPGATVLAVLPEGVNCAPAGEMADIPLWNTTREGYAIVSVLAPRAEVAIVGKRTFLCYCAGGFNELFLEEEPTETTTTQTQSISQTAELILEPKEGVSVTVNNTPMYEQITPVVPVCGNNCSDGPNWSKRILIGVGAAAVAYAVYHFTRDKGLGVDTDGSRKKCTATSYPNTCPTPGVGVSFSLGF